MNTKRNVFPETGWFFLTNWTYSFKSYQLLEKYTMDDHFWIIYAWEFPPNTKTCSGVIVTPCGCLIWSQFTSILIDLSVRFCTLKYWHSLTISFLSFSPPIIKIPSSKRQKIQVYLGVKFVGQMDGSFSTRWLSSKEIGKRIMSLQIYC